MFIERLFNQLNDFQISYDNILLKLLIGDFNMTPEDLKLRDFCDTRGLKNLIKEPTYF